MSKAKDLLEIWNKERNNHDQSINTDEAVDVKKIINDLIKTDWGGSNEEQGKAVQLLRGLAFNDEPAANAFMKDLNTYTSKLDPAKYE